MLNAIVMYQAEQSGGTIRRTLARELEHSSNTKHGEHGGLLQVQRTQVLEVEFLCAPHSSKQSLFICCHACAIEMDQLVAVLAPQRDLASWCRSACKMHGVIILR
jgi:hypothetical protein